jgi:hypothetical protein
MLDQNALQDHRRARRAPGSLAFPSVRASARHDGRRLHECGIQDSEALVQAGAPLVDIGDPLDLEVVADLLSADATQIEKGAAVRTPFAAAHESLLGRLCCKTPLQGKSQISNGR